MKAITSISKTGIHLFLSFITLLLTPACQDDLLDLAPADSISDAVVFDTPERIENLLLGIYDSMKERGYYGSLFLVFSDVRGEDFLNQRMSTGQGLQVWNHTLEESFAEVNQVWNAIYYTINGCNIFIDGIQRNADVLADPQLAAQYEAEARFIRALSYFNLLSLYARPYADGNGTKPGVVLRLEPQPGSGNKDQARATVAEVYEQILADLEVAEKNLRADFGDAYQNTTRVHRNTAIALKTRVLLSMGRYAETVAAAAAIVPAAAPFMAPSGAPHALQADVRKVFSAPYTTSESIFSLPSTDSDPLLNQGAMASYYNPAPVGLADYSLNPEGILGDAAWGADDARRAFVNTEASDNKVWLSKYPDGQPYSDYVPIIRYAEVLLNTAEAITHDCGCVDPRALALLNAVRGRSAPDGIYVAADFANSEELIDAILKERRIEFLGEGFRSLNCTRLLLPIPAKANVSAVSPSQSEYIWPIPISELATNQLCEPNP